MIIGNKRHLASSGYDVKNIAFYLQRILKYFNFHNNKIVMI